MKIGKWFGLILIIGVFVVVSQHALATSSCLVQGSIRVGNGSDSFPPVGVVNWAVGREGRMTQLVPGSGKAVAPWLAGTVIVSTFAGYGTGLADGITHYVVRDLAGNFLGDHYETLAQGQTYIFNPASVAVSPCH